MFLLFNISLSKPSKMQNGTVVIQFNWLFNLYYIRCISYLYKNHMKILSVGLLENEDFLSRGL